MPPTYVFAIDVTHAAVACGAVAAAAAAIKASLDALPGDELTRVGLLTFDSVPHFHTLRPGMSAPQVRVVVVGGWGEGCSGGPAVPWTRCHTSVS
eukprot:354808-Chlamydomonas_euryale.AAC.4